MKLLIDIGNSRVKWALAADGVFSAPGAAMHGGEPARVLAELPAARVEAVWIAQVTGTPHTAALDQAAQARFGRRPHYARSAAAWHGLRNVYVEPERLGVDRWLVMIAAWVQARSACIVVDAGTALTADCVDGQGQHLGGFIAAGLETQQRAVLGATRFAVHAAEARYHGGFGTDTEACVRQGAMLACLGAIDRAAALAGPDARRLITGGDGERLQPHLRGDWEWRPHLVLEGLLAVAEDRLSP